MTLDKLKEKYNPLSCPAASIADAQEDKTKDRQTSSTSRTITSLESWKDSAPVMRLSEYLKMHQDQGIRLCKSNGKPRLIFQPGLGLSDMKTERWSVALNAIDLMQTASHDLKILILNGLIDLQDDDQPRNSRRNVNHKSE